MQQKQYSDTTKVSALGIVYINAIVAAPLTLLLAIALGEYNNLAHFEHLHSTSFWASFLISGFTGLLLMYSQALCTTYNSPLATAVTGNGKDIATTLIGVALFPGFVATTSSVGGIALSFVGAFLYSYASIMKQLRKQAPPPPPQDALESGRGRGDSGTGAELRAIVTAPAAAVGSSIVGAAASEGTVFAPRLQLEVPPLAHGERATYAGGGAQIEEEHAAQAPLAARSQSPSSSSEVTRRAFAV